MCALHDKEPILWGAMFGNTAAVSSRASVLSRVTGSSHTLVTISENVKVPGRCGERKETVALVIRQGDQLG